MTVGDVIGSAASGSWTYQPAAGVQVMLSGIFADHSSANYNGSGGISTGNLTTGATGNYNHTGIGYSLAPLLPKMFLSNANYLSFSGSGIKGFTGIQIS